MACSAAGPAAESNPGPVLPDPDELPPSLFPPVPPEVSIFVHVAGAGDPLPPPGLPVGLAVVALFADDPRLAALPAPVPG